MAIINSTYKKVKRKRPGVHAKTKHSNMKGSSNYKKMYRGDIVLDDDGKLTYSYTYIKNVFEYLHNSAWTPNEINDISGYIFL